VSTKVMALIAIHRPRKRARSFLASPLLAALPLKAERNLPERTKNIQDSVLSLAIFVIAMMILAIVIWECLNRTCVCRRKTVAVSKEPLLLTTTPVISSAAAEVPIIVVPEVPVSVPEVPAKITYRNYVTTDISVSGSGKADKFHLNPKCQGLNAADKDNVKHRTLCSHCWFRPRRNYIFVHRAYSTI
jgi:hypothetical protein